MVDINTSASGLQARLQAQLQAGKNSNRLAAQAPETVRSRPQDVIEERLKARVGRQDEGSQRVPQRQQRSNELSTAEELETAQSRVSDFTGNTREAPIGRTSARQDALRAQPLGQIIDIRV